MRVTHDALTVEKPIWMIGDSAYDTLDWHDHLLAYRQQESLTVYTDGFRAYEPLEEDDAFEREYDIHGDGEYVDGDPRQYL